MAAKTKPRGKQTGSVNLHITLPAELVAALDHCVAEQTRADVWPKPTRTDLIRAVDLFSGAGGFSTGAAHAGVRVVFALDYDASALRTHALNHPSTAHRQQNILQFDPRDLPPYDLLLASPPCTGFSKSRGGERVTDAASRALAWSVVHVVEATTPKYLAIENVPEFLQWDEWDDWTGALRDLGYGLQASPFNASEFGVAQERIRAFHLAVLDRPAPTVRSPRRTPVPMAAILRFDRGKWSPVEGHAAATLLRIENSRARYGSRFVVPYYKSSRVGRSLDRPLGTLTTHDKYAIVDGDRMRMLSLAEMTDAMGFPANYRWAGNYKESVMQLGNAVCPPVAQSLIEQLLAC